MHIIEHCITDLRSLRAAIKYLKPRASKRVSITVDDLAYDKILDELKPAGERWTRDVIFEDGVVVLRRSFADFIRSSFIDKVKR